ncbi:MAG: Xaa-Pro peptidase family protein [Sporolactobacillus sp.]|jgi:Xaa-Pro aminopeptidase|nr:Xaa-Pro peptidase family protein [Sporolactobacillus sp.]
MELSRIDKLAKRMVENDVQAALVSNPVNVRYLSGFTGDDSYLIVTAHDVYFITDGRFTEQAKNELSPNTKIITWKHSLFAEAVDVLNKLDGKRFGFEADQLTYSTGARFKAQVQAELVSISGWIENLRAVKDENEIAKIRAAARIVDQTFIHILDFIRPGVTEKRIAAEMEYYMKKMGSEKTSFETIVVSGVRTSLPHGVAGDKPIERGDLITLDFGATYQGYVSDMTRTIAVGRPDEQLQESYGLVLEAEKAGLEKAQPGMTSKELDAVIRAPFKREHKNQYFIHGAGHSIGLDIHESPYISFRSDHIFRENTIMTVEPGLYLANVGGIRIEDDVLIKTGKNEILTHAPKSDLLILPY